ncbi:hypothetical protein SLS58_003501 [Diplodia intermedia]|uniref:Uncharacterized protein n=1 Tax=Diplodia intermedia TaxID=856260 RepID=A0ABR3TX37_9PEZI
MHRLLQPRQAFEPSCLSGGTWYSCGAGSRFVGCCTSDPCNSRGCSDGNLRAASFNASAYSDFPDAECDSGRFWTCASTDPPFLGCCKVDACQAEGNAGCPDEDLTAAHLPNNDALASAYSPTGGPSSTATATASATGSSESSDGSSASTAGIVGGVIGAVVVLLFVIGALLWRRRSKKKKAAAAAAAASLNGDEGRTVSELAGAGVGQGKGSPLAGQHPPRYSSLTNAGSPGQTYAMELDGYPRAKSPLDQQQTPSELGAGETHAELPGSEAATVHEMEGSSPGTTVFDTGAAASAKSSPNSSSGKKTAAAHSRGSSWSSFNERRAARRASAGGNDGGGGGGGGGGTGPRGLAIVGLHPHSQVNGNGRTSPARSSPRSPSFPGGGGGGGAEEYAGSESGVSSLPSTPRSAYGYGPGAGTAGGYSDVSRLSPTYPPPIREDDVERGEEGGGRYRDHEDDDDDDDDLHDGYGYGNGRRR